HHTATHATYTLPLHDALPISALLHELHLDAPCAGRRADRARHQLNVARTALSSVRSASAGSRRGTGLPMTLAQLDEVRRECRALDRKSTRLNSSHVKNSYGVF